MLSLAGKKYAKNNAEMVGSLFETGGTCAGYYRVNRCGVLFLDLQKNPFAYAVRRGRDSWFVTAGRDAGSGRTRYMFGLGDYTAKQLGIDGLSGSAEALLDGVLIPAATVGE